MEEQLEEQLNVEIARYIEDERSFFQLGDVVQVKETTPEMEETMLPEDYYYLTGFSKKKGIITDIKCGKVVNIYVDFDGTIGIFYEKDLKKIA